MELAADSVTRGLTTWLSARFRESAVVIDDQVAAEGALAIRLGLLSVGVDRSDWQGSALTLSYRIVVEGGDVFERHRLTSEIAFALVDHPVLALKDDQVVPLQLNPVEKDDPLGLLVSSRLTRARRVPSGPPVLVPLVVELAETGTLDGSVGSANGQPVADALVEIPSLDRRQRSLADGSFQFPNLPAEAGPFTVIARKNRAHATGNARPGERLALILSTEA